MGWSGRVRTSSARGGGPGASGAPGGGAPRWREARPEDKAFALAGCAILAAYNNVLGVHPWHNRRYVRVNLCATGTALAAAALSGLTPADLGFGRGRWLPGRTGYRLAGTVAAGWLLIAVVPAARPLLDDKRITSLDRRAAAYQALIRIPVGTALWEEVASDVSGTPRPIPQGVDLSAYRIVQEALSNAMQHAPGAAVQVHLHYGEAALVIEVRNDSVAPGVPALWEQPGEPGRSDGSGHGIIGMRERAAMLGGHLEARPAPNGEFLVTAALPIGSDPEGAP